MFDDEIDLTATEKKLREMEDEGPIERYQSISSLRKKVMSYCDSHALTLDSFRETCATTSKKSWGKFMTYPYKTDAACQMNESFIAVISFFAQEAFNKKVEPLRAKVKVIVEKREMKNQQAQKKQTKKRALVAGELPAGKESRA